MNGNVIGAGGGTTIIGVQLSGVVLALHNNILFAGYACIGVNATTGYGPPLGGIDIDTDLVSDCTRYYDFNPGSSNYDAAICPSPSGNFGMAGCDPFSVLTPPATNCRVATNAASIFTAGFDVSDFGTWTRSANGRWAAASKPCRSKGR